jgi:hypothetical protein
LAIILPQGRLIIRRYKIFEISSRSLPILAVVGLHATPFKPHTGTNTSAIVCAEMDDDQSRRTLPRQDVYNIFFAQCEVRQDNLVRMIWRKISPCYFTLMIAISE